MQNTIKLIIAITVSTLYLTDYTFAETRKHVCEPDSGRHGMANRIDLMEIIESMNEKSIEENYRLIAKIDSTVLRGIPSISPISPTSKPYFTSLFGQRVHPITGKRKQHYGIDIASELSFQYVHSTADGVVTNVSFSNSAGIFLQIDHIAGYSTTYMHLAGVDVSIGERVIIGQTIGWMGASGRVTAKHVHYEIKKKGKVLNPLPYLDLYYRCNQTNLSEKAH
ncbi:Peptidase family M23 [Dyadobacter sp. SG02]|uniref:M23 family metallopeptidase n=1 Tax=Dyadobacter sp. SG02 TaxID=1855291 RepID=UPI0008C21107|nr:M23 family metallopeptidase [Dyadobacter sp. SG02]SEJ74730.1 Peptidase family M23 [Dyadobacter sp. SG02]